MKKLSIILCGLLLCGQVVADTTSDLMGLGMPAALASKVASTFAPLASPTFTGTLSVPAAIVSGAGGLTVTNNIQTSAGDVILNNGALRSNVDSSQIVMSGGSTSGHTSGATVYLSGDDLGGTDAGGDAVISSGDNSGSDVYVDLNASNSRLVVRDSADIVQWSVDKSGLHSIKDATLTNGLNITGQFLQIPRGTNLPDFPGPGQLFVDTNDGACDDANDSGGTATCLYNGSAWMLLGNTGS